MANAQGSDLNGAGHHSKSSGAEGRMQRGQVILGDTYFFRWRWASKTGFYKLIFFFFLLTLN